VIHMRSLTKGQLLAARELCVREGYRVHADGLEFRAALDARRGEVSSLVGGQSLSRAVKFENDVHLGLALRLVLKEHSWRTLSDLGFWRAVSIRSMPDIVVEREPAATETSFSDPVHCYPLRCWRFVDLCWQESTTLQDSVRATWDAVQGLSTDAISALVERPGSGDYSGYRSDVSRELVRQFQFVLQRRQRREDQFRKAVKLCGARMLLEEPVLCDGNVQGFITSIFLQLGEQFSLGFSGNVVPFSSKHRSHILASTDGTAGVTAKTAVQAPRGVPPKGVYVPKGTVATKPAPRPAAKAAGMPAAKAAARSAARAAGRPTAKSTGRSAARAAATPTARVAAKPTTLPNSPQPSSAKVRSNPSVRALAISLLGVQLREWLKEHRLPKSKLELIGRAAVIKKDHIPKLKRIDIEWLWDNGLRAELRSLKGIVVSGGTRNCRYQFGK
jgi:hypothetical protein